MLGVRVEKWLKGGTDLGWRTGYGRMKGKSTSLEDMVISSCRLQAFNMILFYED